ncbi:hypothetical protein ACRALDRAFT_2027896 [Sodiomyces alcalophilus JCM 7366]|uniref:uncharacterized protein n=1 Tax=Sodiomyces alcalophilus JCM 7366 TaxID=591952 RepID=UPI0039B42985
MTDKPEWEVYLDDEIASDIDPSDDYFAPQVAMHEALRSLLHAPEDEDDTAVAKRAVEEYRAYYAKTYHDERHGSYRFPDRGVYAVTYDLTNLAWELATLFPFTDYKHRRLSEFIISLKTLAPQEFDPDVMSQPLPVLYGIQPPANKNRGHLQDPQLLFDPKGVGAVANSYWNGYFARLLDAGLLGKEYMGYMHTDVALGLEKEDGYDRLSDFVKTCREVVATQYILIAGHILAKEAKSPTTTRRRPLNAETWRTWAARLEELAKTAPDDGEWGLKEDAAKAHEKMVDLWPELFET